jgi:CMP-2-keto-3-deoxyoctulosonic acid synthetase
MLDKPIIVLSDHEDIPEKLRKVADVVVIADMDTAAGRRKVQEALTSFMNEHKGNGEDDSTDDDH